MRSCQTISQKGTCYCWTLSLAQVTQLFKRFLYLYKRVYQSPTSYFLISYLLLKVYMWYADVFQELK
uniref:Transmembrane protein n=1 Tax=Medicago truncatula TaxID=3880 RepID=I3SY54_MEDTR|nr:unknown [Medicago truncatula]